MQDELTEAYYRQFQENLSTAELETCTSMTKTEPNRTYTGGDNDYSTRSFQEIFLLMLSKPEKFSGVLNNLKNNNLLGTDNYLKNLTAVFDIL